MNKKIIEITNLSKSFKGKKVLNDINLSINQGEFFGLIGPNGSGKTVLIKSILGIIEPDFGEIKILGENINNVDSSIYQKINFASSYSRLQEQISIYDNLFTFAKIYEIKNPREKIMELTNFFELANHVKQKTKVYDLSSGENTRLVLCKALLNDPQILFLDEPLASLDPLISDKVENFVSKINKKKKITIFYVSHNLSEVKKMCTHVCFLKKGNITKKKLVAELPKLEKLY
jgi:ABC-2 type transport system ATP-binding protein